MKKISYLLLAILLIAGCAKDEGKPSEDESGANPGQVGNADRGSDEETPEKDAIIPYNANPTTFHFVADWLSDESILFIEKEENVYKLNEYNLHTGEMVTIYEEETMIIDVHVHPSRNYILLHTSDHPTSAVVKVVSLSGIVQDTVEIESSELSIEWNDFNPSKIVLTAFHDDWSYDVFYYDGSEGIFDMLDIEDPFPKWNGTSNLITTKFEEHSLDGGELQLFNPLTGKTTPLNMKSIVYFDTHLHSLLTATILDESRIHYQLFDSDETVLTEWKTPAVSNYSEWVLYDIDWMEDGSVVTTMHESGGQLDELEEPFKLYKVNAEETVLLADNIDPGPVHCSPNGVYCMTGATYDKVFDVSSKKEHAWLLMNK